MYTIDRYAYADMRTEKDFEMLDRAFEWLSSASFDLGEPNYEFMMLTIGHVNGQYRAVDFSKWEIGYEIASSSFMDVVGFNEHMVLFVTNRINDDSFAAKVVFDTEKNEMFSRISLICGRMSRNKLMETIGEAIVQLETIESKFVRLLKAVQAKS